MTWVAHYRIDPTRSYVWIDARSSVHPIHSTTKGLEGYLDLGLGPDGAVDLAVVPTGKLSLQVSRLSSGNRLEDRELQRRIDSKRFPAIEGVIIGMEPIGGDGSYRVSGDITFRGTSHRYEDQMTVNPVDDSTIKLAGQSRFDIRDFGMEPPRILMLKVDPEVAVRVEVLAVKEG